MHLYFMQIQQKVSHLGYLLKTNELSINTISPGEEQINKQAKYHPYILDIIYIQLYFKFHANPSVSDLEGIKEKSVFNSHN